MGIEDGDVLSSSDRFGVSTVVDSSGIVEVSKRTCGVLQRAHGSVTCSLAVPQLFLACQISINNKNMQRGWQQELQGPLELWTDVCSRSLSTRGFVGDVRSVW